MEEYLVEEYNSNFCFKDNSRKVNLRDSKQSDEALESEESDESLESEEAEESDQSLTSEISELSQTEKFYKKVENFLESRSRNNEKQLENTSGFYKLSELKGGYLAKDKEKSQLLNLPDYNGHEYIPPIFREKYEL